MEFGKLNIGSLFFLESLRKQNDALCGQCDWINAFLCRTSHSIQFNPIQFSCLLNTKFTNKKKNTSFHSTWKRNSGQKFCASFAALLLQIYFMSFSSINQKKRELKWGKNIENISAYLVTAIVPQQQLMVADDHSKPQSTFLHFIKIEICNFFRSFVRSFAMAFLLLVWWCNCCCYFRRSVLILIECNKNERLQHITRMRSISCHFTLPNKLLESPRWKIWKIFFFLANFFLYF